MQQTASGRVEQMRLSVIPVVPTGPDENALALDRDRHSKCVAARFIGVIKSVQMNAGGGIEEIGLANRLIAPAAISDKVIGITDQDMIAIDR